MHLRATAYTFRYVPVLTRVTPTIYRPAFSKKFRRTLKRYSLHLNENTCACICLSCVWCRHSNRCGVKTVLQLRYYGHMPELCLVPVVARIQSCTVNELWGSSSNFLHVLQAADVVDKATPYVKKGWAACQLGWEKLQPYKPKEWGYIFPQTCEEHMIRSNLYAAAHNDVFPYHSCDACRFAA